LLSWIAKLFAIQDSKTNCNFAILDSKQLKKIAILDSKTFCYPG
jgi:hypothetical protein